MVIAIPNSKFALSCPTFLSLLPLPQQAVVIPIPNSKLGEEAAKAMLDRADAIAAELKAAGATGESGHTVCRLLF